MSAMTNYGYLHFVAPAAEQPKVAFLMTADAEKDATTIKRHQDELIRAFNRAGQREAYRLIKEIRNGTLDGNAPFEGNSEPLPPVPTEGDGTESSDEETSNSGGGSTQEQSSLPSDAADGSPYEGPTVDDYEDFDAGPDSEEE